MRRKDISQLIAWKNNPTRKPLIIRGARQVGKTWLMKYFAQTYYKNHLYVNFETDINIRNIFSSTLNPNDIITALQAATGKHIDKETLVLLDEIQEAPSGITALKYFQEEMPDLHIIAAGSLLGIRMRPDESFPVGKVDFIDLYPLSFIEFIDATGNSPLADMIANSNYEMMDMIAERLRGLLKIYYLTGGMPEAVKQYIDTGDIAKARMVQKNILTSYDADFAKHIPSTEVSKVRMVWQSLIGQLAKENKKFIYGALREGSRAKEFENAIQWLVDAGLIYKVNRINKGELPLGAFEDFSTFKLYCLDVGLLSAMGDIPPKIIIEGDNIFGQFKGALTEQYVLQQMKCCGIEKIGYWSSAKSTAEIDFLIQHNGTIYPIEVKAEENLKAKSLKLFVDKHHGLHGIRFSMSPYRKQDWLTNIPLYGVDSFALNDSF